jgi:hypothetical protein
MTPMLHAAYEPEPDTLSAAMASVEPSQDVTGPSSQWAPASAVSVARTRVPTATENAAVVIANVAGPVITPTVLMLDAASVERGASGAVVTTTSVGYLGSMAMDLIVMA